MGTERRERERGVGVATHIYLLGGGLLVDAPQLSDLEVISPQLSDLRHEPLRLRCRGGGGGGGGSGAAMIYSGLS